MLLNVLIAVFLAGLMIGRTPEYLGKKLQAREVQLLVATLLVMPVGVLVLGAIAASLPGPVAAVSNPGPHGFSQLLYAYTSASANNGSAFTGFGANTVFHNLMLGLSMLIGRFGYILPVLALAGSLALKTRRWLAPSNPALAARVNEEVARLPVACHWLSCNNWSSSSPCNRWSAHRWSTCWR